jgi:hypothetical protein
MIKDDWLAAPRLVALHWSFLIKCYWRKYNLQIVPANGKKLLAAEEIYQTLLSNRKPVYINKLLSLSFRI